MTTPRIEEMVEEWKKYADEEFSYSQDKDGGWVGDLYYLAEDVEQKGSDWIRKALTEAHQAGSDEGKSKLAQTLLVLIEMGNENTAMNIIKKEALDDTIKPLQDNK